MFGPLPLIALASAPALSMSIVDAEDLSESDLERLAADLAFELERHTGEPVTVQPIPTRFPSSSPVPGLWVRAFRGVSNIRVILEDHRAAERTGASEFADLSWPLSASREDVHRLLTAVLGPAVGLEGRPGGSAQLTVPPAPEAGSAGPVVLLATGLASAGVALGFGVASASARHGDGVAELRPPGAVAEANTLTTVSIIGLGVAGASLLTSALWTLLSSPEAP